MKIEIIEKEGVFTSSFDSEEVSKVVGKGLSIKESIQNLLLNQELSDEDDEDEKVKIFIRENMPEARRIAWEFYEHMGGNPMNQVFLLKKMPQYRRD
jgi:hypothetical protein